MVDSNSITERWLSKEVEFMKGEAEGWDTGLNYNRCVSVLVCGRAPFHNDPKAYPQSIIHTHH